MAKGLWKATYAWSSALSCTVESYTYSWWHKCHLSMTFFGWRTWRWEEINADCWGRKDSKTLRARERWDGSSRQALALCVVSVYRWGLAHGYTACKKRFFFLFRLCPINAGNGGQLKTVTGGYWMAYIGEPTPSCNQLCAAQEPKVGSRPAVEWGLRDDESPRFDGWFSWV